MFALGAPGGSSAAQSAPAAPDTTPIVGSGSPGYLRLFDRVSTPVIIAERSYRVLLAAAPTGATLDATSVVDTLVRSCASTSRPSAVPPEYRPGAVSIDGTRYFVVVALSASAYPGSCEGRWNRSAASIWNGISFGRSSASDIPTPRSLRLYVDGKEAKPERAVARPAFEVRDGAWVSVPSQLRYYYPMSLLAPNANGSTRHLTVEVWDTRGSASSFEIGGTDDSQLRFDYAAWRLATTQGREQAVRLSPATAVPAEVRSALDLASRGQTDEGALRAAELLALTAHTEENAYQRDVATMLVAEALYQHQDSADAMSLVRGVRARRPCIAAPSGASPALVASITAVRARQCDDRNVLATLGAGLVLPGGGHIAQHRPLYATLAAAALSGVFASAYTLESSAKSSYAAYEATHVANETGPLFARAESQRSAARSRVRLGLALWGADALAAAYITSMMHNEVSRGRL